MSPEIAIIDSNTLSCLGLESLLTEMIPEAVVRIFPSFEEFMDDTPDMYAHYFVSTQVYFNHTAFFLARKPKCIVLSQTDHNPQLNGVATIHICQDQQHIVKSIMQLRQHGHPGAGAAHQAPHASRPMHPMVSSPSASSIPSDLSRREQEVLCLLVRGLINKEIADRLHISLTTVITHRKNITEKLGIKSLSGLTIYAVMHGLVEIDSI